ncbi:12638_t:CDS:1, partial [Ambispora leptoticha]
VEKPKKHVQTCFVGGLLAEIEKICSAYFVGGKDEIEAEKNTVFVGGDSSMGTCINQMYYFLT